MKTAVDLLLEAKALLSSREKWTTDALARDAFGLEIEPTAPNATCWCVEGALRRVAGLGKNSVLVVEHSWNCLVNAAGTSSPIAVNDGQTLEDVHAMLDRAIARAKELT